MLYSMSNPASTLMGAGPVNPNRRNQVHQFLVAPNDCMSTQIGTCSIGLISIQDGAADFELAIPGMAAVITAPVAADQVTTEIELVHFAACAFRESAWSAGNPVGGNRTGALAASVPLPTPMSLPALLRQIGPGTHDLPSFALDVRPALVQQLGWVSPWALQAMNGYGPATHLVVRAWTDQLAIQLLSQL